MYIKQKYIFNCYVQIRFKLENEKLDIKLDIKRKVSVNKIFVRKIKLV